MLLIFQNRYVFFKESAQIRSKCEGVNIRFRHLRPMKIDLFPMRSTKKELTLSNFNEKTAHFVFLFTNLLDIKNI